MPLLYSTSLSPVDLVSAAFHLPLFSLVVAVFTASVMLLTQRARRTGDHDSPDSKPAPLASTTRYLHEWHALRLGAIGVISLFAVENVVRGYVLDLADVVEWWQYATPLGTALLCNAVVLVLIVARGSSRPVIPLAPSARRTWMTFGPRAGVAGAGLAMVALTVTTVAAGLASSADARGRYIYLQIDVPNVPVSPLRPWFYGWSYGVPVLICVVALVVVTWAALHRNAMRPFLRSDALSVERAARARVASGVVHIATAGALLALGGAFRFIARAGSISQLTTNEVDGRVVSYDTGWRYAELATTVGWLAPILEITAFMLLLFIASRPLLPQAAAQHMTPESRPVDAR